MKENLREILTGGQTFSWKEEEDGLFSAVLNEKVYRIRSLEDASSDAYLREYFDLDYDYEKAMREIAAKDEILRAAVESTGLLRILKQDHFIATISFILSQNNNIKRITGLYDRFCRAFGHEVEPGYFSFPTKKELGNVSAEDFRALGCGFRAPFLVDAVSKADMLDDIESMDFDSAMNALMNDDTVELIMLPDDTEQRLKLIMTSEEAWRIIQARGEPPYPSTEKIVKHRAHGAYFSTCRFPARILAHRGVAQRRMGSEECFVDAYSIPHEDCPITIIVLPGPVIIRAKDILHCIMESFAAVGENADAAVSGDIGHDPLPDLRLHIPVPQHLEISMCMHVDEAGRKDKG